MDGTHDTATGISALFVRIRDGDETAWRLLTDRYTNLLWSIARGMRLNDADAADAVQTAWLRLVEQLDTIRDPERVGGWLATTVRRECLAILRRPAIAGEWEDIPDPAELPDAALLRSERDAELRRALALVRPQCQLLLRVLMADPAPDYAEVAAVLDMPVGSIGPTRQRCLGALRRILRTGIRPLGLPSREKT